VLAEFVSNPSEDLYLAVPAGEYRFVRRTMGEVRERTLALAPGSVTSIDPASMARVAQESSRSKNGGLELRNQLGAYAGISTSAVPGSPSYVGTFALSYARDFGRLALRGRASGASFDSQQDVYRSSLLRATVNADLLFPLLRGHRFSVQLGPTLGLPMVRQRNMVGVVSSSFGFAYGGALAVSARLYDRTSLSLNLDGGGEIFRLDGQAVHRTTGSALLGGIVAF
jgi:uncharacterized protein YfiM (DUF2279 family)